MFLNDFWIKYGEEIILSTIFVVTTLLLFVFLILNLRKKDASKKVSIIAGVIFAVAILSVNLIIYNDYQKQLSKDPEVIFPYAKVILFNVFLLVAFSLIWYFLTNKKSHEKVSVATVATLGLLTALASVLMLFGIPIFPNAPYLKVEVSALIYFMIFLWFGIKPTILVIFLTNFIHALMPSITPPVILFLDEMVNVVACVAYLTPSFIIFRKRKENEAPSFNKVIVTAIIGVLFTTIFMVLYNYFINLPLIYDMKTDFLAVLSIFGLFNLIKWGSVSVVVVLLYRKINSLKEHFTNYTK